MSVPTDKIILSSAMVTLGSTVAASTLPTKYGGQGELPSPRLLIGTSLTFLGMSILGDMVPAIAGPLSAGIAITALTYYGIPVLDNWFNADQPNRVNTPVGKPPTKE